MPWTPTVSGHNLDGIQCFDGTSQVNSNGPLTVSKVGNSQDVFIFAGYGARPADGSSPLVQSKVFASVSSADLTTVTVTLDNACTPGNVLLIEAYYTSISGSFIGCQPGTFNGDTLFPQYWLASFIFGVSDQIIDPRSGNLLVCQTGGTSDSSMPIFNTTVGGLTTDNTVVWRTLSPGGVSATPPIMYGIGSGSYAFRSAATVGASGNNAITFSFEGPSGGGIQSFNDIVIALSEYKAGCAPGDAVQVYSLSGNLTDPIPVVTPTLITPTNYLHLCVLTHAYFAVPVSAVRPLLPASLPAAWYVANEPGIGLTDRSAYLYCGQGTKHSGNLQARQRGNWSYTLIVAEGNSYEPTLFQPVYFYDDPPAGYQIVFSGIVQSFKDRQIARDGWRYIDVTAVSLEAIFDTVYVSQPQEYVNQTCGFILTDLFTRFESGSPVTLGTVQAGATLPIFNAPMGTKLSDLWTQLATTSEFTWNVNAQTQQFFFGAPTAVAAPFAISSGGVMWDTIAHGTDGSDYRNRQGVRLSFDAFSHSMEYFTGSGQKSFTLARPVKQVVAAYVTLSTPNHATAALSGQPSPGDTFTVGPASGVWQATHTYAIGGVIVDNAGFVQKITTVGSPPLSGSSYPFTSASEITGATTTDGNNIWTCQGPLGLGTGASTYTWTATLDNTQYGQVLIGANVAASIQNAADALNANAAVRGTTFSLPTWENSQINALSVTGTGFTAQQKAAGSGWVASLSATGTAFSWSAPQTSGGTSPQGSVGPNEGATISIQVYAQGTSTAAPGLAYTEGSAVVNLATPLNSGTNLNVEYTRTDGDVIECERTDLVTAVAATSHGTGKFQQITDQSSLGLISTNALAGLQLCQQALSSYDVPPEDVELEILVPGILPGQLLTVDLTGYWSLLNTSLSPLVIQWYVEEVRVEYVQGITGQSPWMNQIGAPGGGHYRYTLHLINVSQIGSYLDWWMGLGGGSSGGSSGPLAATSGGALATQGQPNLQLEVNGTANASQAILNLANGSAITVTDAGAGTVDIAAVTATSSALGVVKPDNTSITISGGVLTATGAGLGTVTSVALTVPAWLTVAGSPITTAGTLAVTGTSEPANEFLASPNGSPGAMTPRLIVAADLPLATSSTVGVVKPDGTIITVSAGAITVPKASNSVFGVVEVDNTTITASAGVISAVAGAGSPLTTKGDVYTYGTTNARLPVGSNGQVLTANSAATDGIDWETPTATGGVNAQTSSYAAVSGDSGKLISLSGGGTLSLPSPAVSSTWSIHAENTGASPVTVSTYSGTFPAGFTLRLTGAVYDAIQTFDRAAATATSYGGTITATGTCNIFAILTALKPSGGSPPVFVQGAFLSTANALSLASVACAFGIANVAGNCLVMDIYATIASGPVATLTVTDTRGNTWTLAAGGLLAGGSGYSWTYTAPNCAAGANTVTATPSVGTISDAVIAIHEYSGVVTSSPVDATNANASYTATTETVTVTTTGTNRLLHLFGATRNNFLGTSLLIDGSAAALTLTQNQGVYLSTDGTNYFTERGLSAGGGGTVTAVTGTAPIVSSGGTTPAISVTAATSGALGVVQPDGTIITVAAGAITVAKSTSSLFGVAKVDGTTITASAGVISAVGTGYVPLNKSVQINGIEFSDDYILNVNRSTPIQVNGTPANPPLMVDGAPGIAPGITSDGNIFKKYNALTTAGFGVMPILVAADVTGKIAGFTVVTLTPGTAGTFRVGGYVTITAVSLDVLQLQLTWTDETSTSRTLVMLPVGGATLTTTGAFSFPCVDIRVKISTAISLAVVLTTGTGSVAYDAGGSIMEIT